MTLLNPSIEQLVQEIVAVNHAWKEAKVILNDSDSASPLVNSLRDLKTRLQIRLLRTYAPEQVYLAEDKETESEEPLYGLLLVNSIENWKDAAHIPVRVAKKHFSTEEIKLYMRFAVKSAASEEQKHQQEELIVIVK